MLVIVGFDQATARMAARKLRAERICCRIVPGDAGADEILAEDPCGIIFCASLDMPFPALKPELMALPVPMLAIGAAAGALAVHLGGACEPFLPDRRMMAIHCHECPLLENVPSGERMISGILPVMLPVDVDVVAEMGDSRLPFAFSNGAKKRFGTLMELEPHDPDSTTLLENFALKVCGCTAWWDEDAYVSQTVSVIRREAGDGAALCMMTGGLHASVAALLGARALGDRMVCVFINTGLLQEGEEAAFEHFFTERLHLPVIFQDESERFLSALKGIRAQEEKRAAVHSLMRVISREIQRKLPDLTLIIQDRVYAELPQGESLPPRPGVKSLEPLQDLFQDEVRQIGSYLGLPYDMIAGQLIPDTGLALNMVGEVTDEKLAILRRADAIFRANVQKNGLSRKFSEYYAVLRNYDKDTYSVILRALSMNQGDQVRAARAPYDMLEESAEEIRRECPSVMRVLYDLTPTSRQ